MGDQIIRVERLDQRFQQVQNKMRELESELSNLRVERSVLARLRTEAEEMPNGTGPSLAGEGTRRRSGATEAILQLADSEPGLTAKEIVDRLENVVESDASNRRKMMYTTVGNLKKTGRLSEFDGRLYPRDFEQETLLKEIEPS